MNTKITIGVVVVLVIIGGLFFVFKGTAGAPAPETETGAAAAAPQVQGQDVTVGTGAEATPGSVVSVLYVGYVGEISTSTIFDSSAAHDNKPTEFTLGAQDLIAGFQIGVNGMKVGGERLLSIPPELGYGAEEKKDAAGKVVIPANSTLIFDVKLVDVKPGAATPTTPATP
ncbi:MAG TPA: FKBP-type peptidyl-prolyl cis-trans isomerase [Candidatus Paceibacterota bacterium]